MTVDEGLAVVLLQTTLYDSAQASWRSSVEAFNQSAGLSSCVNALETECENNALLFLHGHQKIVDKAQRELGSLPGLQLSVSLEPVAGYGWWHRGPMTNLQGMLLTVFSMRFPESQARDRFIEATRSHSHYCWDNEPDTQVYGLGKVSGKTIGEYAINQGDLIVVMICTDEEAQDKHRNDPRHLKLGTQIAELGIEVKNTFAKTYQLSGHGFLGLIEHE
jgi:hypothetical protein|tara:strand:- start:3114 stop:3770 length:657 start_codon:yes stop_codon:yes gene_type:complete